MERPRTSPRQDASKDAAATTAEPPAQRTNKESTAGYLCSYPFHLCVKALWLGTFRMAARTKPVTRDSVEGFMLLMLVLAAADVVLQVRFLGALERAGGGQPGAASFRLGSGAWLALAYILGCLPLATSPFVCFEMFVFVNFVFNAGCLLEVRFGPFERVVERLVGA